MIMNKMLLVLLVTIAMVGTVNALPTIDICSDSPSTCTSSGPLTVYKDVDASVNPGLHALYKGWDTSGAATYQVSVTDLETNTVVYGPTGTTIGGDPQKVYYAWTPTKLGENKYRVRATGSQITGALETDIIVSTRPGVVPELPTSALLSVGLIGLIGIVKLRRKN